MKPSLSLLLFVPLLAFASPDEEIIRAVSQQTKLPVEQVRQHYDACDSGVTLQMSICTSYRWQVEDRRLNQVYREARTAVRKRGYEESLVRSQRAWMAYRDSFCAFEGKMGAGGGSAEGLHVLGCKVALTKQQADRLEATTKTP